MSRLNIADISFCEAALSNQNQVIGGAVTSGASGYFGAWTASYDASSSSDYFVGYSVDRNTGAVSYVISGYVASAVAAGLAAAITDGNGGVSVFASAFATT
jgi:hypothetical protein